MSDYRFDMDLPRITRFVADADGVGAHYWTSTGMFRIVDAHRGRLEPSWIDTHNDTKDATTCH